MITRKPTINETFPDVIINNGTLFTALNLLNVPWRDDIDGLSLDTEYFYNISGQKSISPLLNRVLDSKSVLSTTDITLLANTLYNLHITKWNKLYNTLSLVYNPISNYDMTETEEISGENANTLSRTGTIGTQSSETATGSGTGSTDSDIYGFNSSSAVNDSTVDTTTSNTNSASGSTTTTNNLTDTTNGTNSTERTLTRSGNIGVTTSQQMIQAERDLWLWEFIYKVVFPDVDKFLTIQTYSRAGVVYSGGSSQGGGTGSDTTAILNAIVEATNAINTNTYNVTSNLATKTDVTNAVTSINDNTNTGVNNIRNDITGVSTDEY